MGTHVRTLTVHLPGIIEEATLEKGNVNQRTVVVHEFEEEYFKSAGKENHPFQLRHFIISVGSTRVR